jgi:uncharacterized protein GlcG (DUF336 family)
MELTTVAKRTLTLGCADAIGQAAVDKSEQMGKAMVIAVMDATGDLLSFRRMDGAPKLSIGIAQDKAYTAAAFGLATHQWHEFISNDPPLALGIVHTPRLVVFGGGYPIAIDGEVVGAIGVSGGHYSEDMEVAVV